MVASGNDVYVGSGYFGAWNTVYESDGTNWNQLPFLLSASSFTRIDALAAVGSDLYIGGNFTSQTRSLSSTSGFPVNYIGKWDGSNFSLLGSGMNAPVSALAISGNTLYAGGDFDMAGRKASAYLAKAKLPVAPGRLENWTYSPAAGASWTFTGGTVGRPYRFESATSLAGSWIAFTNFTYTEPFAFRRSAIPGSNRFFRAVSP